MIRAVDSEYIVFSDASFDPHLKFGVAGKIVLSSIAGDQKIETKVMESPTCSRMEFEAILWALESLKPLAEKPKVTVYTDCQGVVELSERLPKLLARGFKSQRTGKLLAQADLYQDFSTFYSTLHLSIFWTKGHTPLQGRDWIQNSFAALDQSVRNELRRERLKRE